MNTRYALFFGLALSGVAGSLVSCGGGDNGTTAAAPSPGAPGAPTPVPPIPSPPTPAPPVPPSPAPTPPPAPTPAPPPSTATPTLARTVVVTGLTNPWDLAFLPNGAMLFTEKCRGLSMRPASGGAPVRLFGTTGSALVASDLFCEGQSGVHGVAVDPDFATNRYVYVFMASNINTNPRTNRVVRIQLDPTFTTASNRTDIITDMAYKDVATANGGAGAHSGGRIRFGPDGFLYVTTGDNHNATLPQDLNRLGSKVIRVTRDGAAAPGNNTPSGGDLRIYTFGHRNVQGITFRPAGQPNAGQAFTAEHGPNHSDEVTPLVAGGNAGWDPQNRTPPLTCPDNYCGYAGNPTTMPMTDTARFPSAMRPTWVHNTGPRGMGPLTFLSGIQWKGWDGRLAVSIMDAQNMHVLTLDAAGIMTSDTVASLTAARYRSLVQGPDGNLYVVTDGGEIWRVVPS